MTFLARLAQFLFWLLVLSWSVALLRRLVVWAVRGSAASARSGERPAAASRRLHRDPVCGTHVSEEISFPLREGGATLHFCSEACREKYVSGERFVANG